jgi:hypothetical protein
MMSYPSSGIILASSNFNPFCFDPKGEYGMRAYTTFSVQDTCTARILNTASHFTSFNSAAAYAGQLSGAAALPSPALLPPGRCRENNLHTHGVLPHGEAAHAKVRNASFVCLGGMKS